MEKKTFWNSEAFFSFLFCKLKKKSIFNSERIQSIQIVDCSATGENAGLVGGVSFTSLHLLLLYCCLHNNKNHRWKWDKKGEERTLCSCKFLCRCRARVTCFSAFFTSLSSSCSAWLVRSSWINSSRFSFPSNICIKSNQRDPQISIASAGARPCRQGLARRSWTAGSAPPFRATDQVYAPSWASALFSAPPAVQADKELSYPLTVDWIS